MKRYSYNANVIIMFVLIGVILLPVQTFGQYYSERVLEKSFERSNYFFAPNYLNPYSLTTFGTTTPGLIDDPLLNMIVNPAHFYGDSTKTTYIYLDFRNSRTIEENNNYYPCWYGGYCKVYAPWRWTEPHKEIQPILSVAFLTRPFKGGLKNFFAGVTYQTIILDEKYYAVPDDIYRSNIGADYAGNKMVEDSQMPIIDRYSGDDNMSQTAHFLTFYSGYQLSDRAQIGVRMNRSFYDREGAYGSKNYWEYLYDYDSQSLWYSSEERAQDYDHWDLSGGIRYNVSKNMTLGATFGHLWGDIAQTMTMRDSSFYRYGNIDTGDEWSLYQKSGRSNKNWDHAGDTYYGGLDVQVALNDFQTVRMYYLYMKKDIDIFLSSTLTDTSYSNYYYSWDDYYSRGLSDYALSDLRSGSGMQKEYTHRGMIAFQWQLEKDKKLNIGINVEHYKRDVHTSEYVYANSHSESFWQSTYYPDERHYYFGSTEKKELLWDFNARILKISIPLVFQWKVSKAVEFLFGFNRQMSSWEIEETTLALFDYRRTVDNDQVTKKTNFGERYRQPKETISETTTTLLGGVTFSPSKQFSVRFLFVPNFADNSDETEISDYQWWIGVTLQP